MSARLFQKFHRLCSIFVIVILVAASGSSAKENEELSISKVWKRKDNRGGRWLHCVSYCKSMDVQVMLGGFYSQNDVRQTTGAETSSVVPAEVFDFATETWSIPTDLGLNGDESLVLPRMKTCHLALLEGSEESCTFSLLHAAVDGDVAIGVHKVILSRKAAGEYSVSYESTTNEGTSWPSRRSEFCATSHGTETFLYGGREEDKDFRNFGDLWKLSAAVNGDGRMVVSWREMPQLPNTIGIPDGSSAGAAESPGDRFYCAMTALGKPLAGNATQVANATTAADTDRATLVLSGGLVPGGSSGISGETKVRGNDLWLYDIAEQSWRQTKEASSEEDGAFQRSYHSVVSYSGQVFLYGGYFSVGGSVLQQIFPRNLMQTSPFETENPQQGCNQGGANAVVGLWCELDWSVGIPNIGYAANACIVRESQMVCTFGINVYESNGFASVRMQAFDLEGVLDNLVVALEDFNEFQGATTSVYLFFTLLVIVVVLIFLSAVRNRHYWREGNFANYYGQQNRAASASLIENLPLVPYEPPHDAERNNEEETSGSGHRKSIEEQEQEGEICSICLTEFESGEMLKQLPCKHLYHPDCIGKWLPQDKSCPLCKQDIDSFDLPVRSQEGETQRSNEVRIRVNENHQTFEIDSRGRTDRGNNIANSRMNSGISNNSSIHLTPESESGLSLQPANESNFNSLLDRMRALFLRKRRGGTTRTTGTIVPTVGPISNSPTMTSESRVLSAVRTMTNRQVPQGRNTNGRRSSSTTNPVFDNRNSASL